MMLEYVEVLERSFEDDATGRRARLKRLNSGLFLFIIFNKTLSSRKSADRVRADFHKIHMKDSSGRSSTQKQHAQEGRPRPRAPVLVPQRFRTNVIISGDEQIKPSERFLDTRRDFCYQTLT
ncbi:uncharacterized protein V6R79_014214 [Siganus canaliculatus]